MYLKSIILQLWYARLNKGDISMNNRVFEQSIFKNNPKDVFRDLGEQVFNQFSSKFPDKYL